MRFLIKGSSGLIGTELVSVLSDRGHDVVRLVRSVEDLSHPEYGALLWDPKHTQFDPSTFEGFDCVVNLGGENIATGRWTENKKEAIRESRVIDTHILSELLTKLSTPPKLFINASAIGYYGNRGDLLLSETSPQGTGFLSEVCRDWENATKPAEECGIRVVNLRIGLVLSEKGGALKKILPPFTYCLGGRIGSGKQYISWIALDDLVAVILHTVLDKTLRGTVNAVAPEAVTNQVFTKTLGHVLGRPTPFPLPAWAVRMFFGEMGEELLLSSTRVDPKKLKESNYQYLFPTLEKALKHCMEPNKE